MKREEEKSSQKCTANFSLQKTFFFGSPVRKFTWFEKSEICEFSETWLEKVHIFGWV